MQNPPEAIGKRSRSAQAWPLLAVGALGLAIALGAWIAVSVWEARLAKAKFESVAGDYATALQSGLNAYLDKIQAVRALFDASHEVDRREFSVFTDQILAGHGDTMRLLWLPRVGRDERASFERAVREKGDPDFSIKTWAPAGPVVPRTATSISRSSIPQSRMPDRPPSARTSIRSKCEAGPFALRATRTA